MQKRIDFKALEWYYTYRNARKEVLILQSNINELKAECVRHGLTLENLAVKIGVNPATLHRKLNGETEFRRNELQIIKTTLNLNDKQFLSIFLTINLQKCKYVKGGRMWKIFSTYYQD